ncbi:MAG: segregation/condensation protein A [Candidatus Eisenbacteria bacterium]
MNDEHDILPLPSEPVFDAAPDAVSDAAAPPATVSSTERTADVTVESPAARERDGGPVVRPARPGVTFKLPRFEGPLDLLLHLIKRDEVDIHDIPIAHITKQYLDYIELMRMLDLDVAGDFLVMAATLMRIKAKMLLPLPASNVEEEEGDPREELVQRLLEYRLYKEAAENMQGREAERRTWHERGMVPGEDDAGPLPLAPATLFDLIAALQRVMARKPERVVYSVQTEGYDIEDKMSLIAREVAEIGEMRFSLIMSRARARMEIIVSFMALLELIKLGKVIVIQDANFDDILILPRLTDERTPDASAEPALGG